jgi:hypothetical protein
MHPMIGSRPLAPTIRPGHTLALGLVVLLALAAGLAVVRGDLRLAVPTLQAGAAPDRVAAGPASAAAASTGTPERIDLVTPTGNDVAIVLDDATGDVVAANVAATMDGVSVGWDEVRVENVDASTLRLTWAGAPLDGDDRLGVRSSEGQYRLDVARAAAPSIAGAIGFDRVLLLRFGAPLRAADVAVSITD